MVDLKDLDDDNDGIFDTDECTDIMLVDQNFGTSTQNLDLTGFNVDNADGEGWKDFFINGVYNILGNFGLEEGLTNEAIYTRVF